MIKQVFSKESRGHAANENLPGENPNRHPGPGGETDGSYFPEELEPPIGEDTGWVDNIDWGAAGNAFTALCVVGLIAGAIYLTRKSSDNSRRLSLGGAH